jgi:phage tail protein X
MFWFRPGIWPGRKARHEASLAVLERLAAANPGSAEAQRDLSVSLNKLGDVLVQAGDLAAARERYQASLAVAERLAAANPGSAEAQRDLWVSLWKLASLEGTGMAWKDVLARMEAMKAAGTLFPADEPFLEQARQKAAAEAD